MTGHPQEAVQAAAQTYAGYINAPQGLPPLPPKPHEVELMCAVLDAAAPLIAAAERERIRQLAIAKGAYYATKPHGMPLAPFADLLTEGGQADGT